MSDYGPYPVLTAEAAARLIRHNDTVAFSGFSPAGAAKAVPKAIADRASRLKAAGEPFKIRALTGASSGETLDQELARADALSWRAPYQAETVLRKMINREEVEYVDMHLSHVPQAVAFGFFGKIDFAVVEATEITPDGRVYLTTSIGASPSYLRYAERVIIEINRHQSPRLREMADILIMAPPPRRQAIQIFEPLSRIGMSYALVDPKKVVGIVETDEPDRVAPFTPPEAASEKIAAHVVRFLLEEMAAKRIPKSFLPLQAGVGNLANSVLSALGENPEIPDFMMYSEVFQDSMASLMKKERLTAASATSLTVTPETLRMITDNFDFFASRIVLRPQELSNHPAIIRRLGVIALNTALEFDIYGNVNSSHVCGIDVMNGVGGSGEFTRNGYLSILMTPSIAKGGKISSVVPMTPHVDNNEHSVQVVVTEQGLADLRGRGPMHRAQTIIDKCAHPMYRDYLRRYLAEARPGHIRHDLDKCYELHRNLIEYGEMLPER
jgi:propionyl-CoA:succinyl-CoA transferase